ncbi:polyphenol oxidase family protein [Ruminococcus flavefaciens]|uniref:polyphenol oxidase family protein n=1 Tax=Ruminococcus flavefaciens TaxID=1265 RepID=UPI0026ECA1A9|nr:polyphenol oxidase family protein [Ruminococcus flavefaciens]MDD7515472.1 polyphenol oxidase family protein [Ruminococcus flavefaciens]MDY5692669.1 polyphenol oxidase family protein [Ruminococcus flavefaciens]
MDKKDIFIDNSFAIGGFTAGANGIWTRESPDSPPTEDYIRFCEDMGISLDRVIRPYQANAMKAAEVSPYHGGSGVIKDNELTKTDGLVTSHSGLMLSVIAADCAPVYLMDENAGVIGLLHCGWRSAAGELIYNGIEKMRALGASPENIRAVIGHHICRECYEVKEDVRAEFAKQFSAEELESIFTVRDGHMYLDISRTIILKVLREGISPENISDTGVCTCHNSEYFSYRRGDRGKQNLAFLMMRRKNS